MKEKSDILALRNLSIGYRPKRGQITTVAENLDVSLQSGELVCLLGPNGAGKSTLMRTIAGMQLPTSGEVLLGGENIHRINARDLAKKLGVVLTEKITIGTLSAYGLVALGRYPYTNWAGTLTEKDHEIIQNSLKIVGAIDLASRNISELSDGERQKVMVARALAQEPQILILDEITAFLDLPRRVEIMRLLRQMTRKTGKVVLLSTHDLDLALRTADKLWLLDKNGNFRTGSPEDLVLSGDFEQAFVNEGIQFDRNAGYFKLHKHNIGKIILKGEGIVVKWTEKALERQGFEVITNEENGNLRIEVKSVAEKNVWHLHQNGTVIIFDSIYDLSRRLEDLQL